MVGNAAKTDSNIKAFDDAMSEEMEKMKKTKKIKEYECNQLVHGDIHYENVIWDPINIEILAVVDWEFASIGHGVMVLAHISGKFNFEKCQK